MLRNPAVFAVAFLFLLNVFFLCLLAFRYLQRKRSEAEAGLHEITHIWNRAHFFTEAERMLKNTKKTYAVLHLDISEFHRLNEIYGYHTADQILRLFGNILKSGLCKGNGVCCTLWADRHAALLEYRTKEQLEKAYFSFCNQFSSRIKKICDTPVIIKSGVCISTFCQETHTDIRELLHFAEEASLMLSSPSENSLSWYTTRLVKSQQKKAEFEKELAQAFHTNRFHSFYQPKYDLYTGEILGAEALIRWIHDEHGIIMPLRFLPDLEKSGAIIDVDLYVFDEVCRQMSLWIKNDMLLVPISCNFSSLHFQNPMFPSMLYEITEKYQTPADLFEIEIKESTAVSHMLTFLPIAEKLKAYGFRITIDGFGSDYMSLHLLHQLPIDVIKLDKSLLLHTPPADRERIIIHSIIHLAQSLNISVICEGVESEAQVEYMKLAGCRKAQGYYYEAPLPVNEFEKRLAVTHSLPAGSLLHKHAPLGAHKISVESI